MSLGENLQFLRKRDNITQEQLAERLDVSRQSVSKWESDTTYPEMDKLLQLCQMFHCSMDDLVQGNIRDIHVEGKTEYDQHMNQYSKYVSIAVGLILLGLSVMFMLYGSNIFLSADGIIREEFTTMIFFIFLTVSVAIFIVTGIQHSGYVEKNPLLENFYTQKEIDAFNKKFSVMIAVGVSIILIAIIIMMGVEAAYPQFEDNEYLESILSAVFMLCIAISVTILVYAGMQKSKYNIDEYNKENDTESDVYRKNKIKSSVCACIMMISTIIYLVMGFCYGGWGMPYVVIFAVGGILCGIASIIINSFSK